MRILHLDEEDDFSTIVAMSRERFEAVADRYAG